MGGGAFKKTEITPAPSKVIDSKRDVRSVWLLTYVGEKALQQRIKQIKTGGKVITTQPGVVSWISYMNSLSNCNVILVALSAFISEIVSEICTLSTVASFISSRSCTIHTPLNVPENYHFASSCERLLDVINDEYGRISNAEKSVKIVIHEETVNRLVDSFSGVPIYRGSNEFMFSSISYAFSFRAPKMTLLWDNTPEIEAKIFGEVHGTLFESTLCAAINIIVDEPRNEIYIELQRLNATEIPKLKDIDLSRPFESYLKQIKIPGPMNLAACLPLNILDGPTRKALHTRPHGLRFKIHDHYLVFI